MGLSDRRYIKRAYYSPAMTNSRDVSATVAGAIQVDMPTDIGFEGMNCFAGELIGGAAPLPWDFDPDHPLRIRVLYSATGAAKTMEWILLAKLIANGEALIAHGSLSALDTVIPVHTTVDTKGHNVTAWGIIDDPAAQVTRAQCDAGALFQFRCEAQALGSGLTLPTYYGIELGYIPMPFGGEGSIYGEVYLGKQGKTS